jgi:hypothetical protein
MHPEQAGAFNNNAFVRMYKPDTSIWAANDHPMDVAFLDNKPVQAVNHHSF